MSTISTAYGYIRDLPCEQNEDRQLIAMNDLSIPNQNIFMDKQSGKDFDQAQYKRLVKKLKLDALLYIKSIDRLVQNYTEILEQRRILTKGKKQHCDTGYAAAGNTAWQGLGPSLVT